MCVVHSPLWSWCTRTISRRVYLLFVAMCLCCSGATSCPPWSHVTVYLFFVCISYQVYVWIKLVGGRNVGMQGVGLRERWRYSGAWGSASGFYICWGKVATRKVRNWAQSVTGSDQEFDFSRCRIQGGSARFDDEFELTTTCKSGHVSWD